jgi:hypothetical protein
MRYYTNLLLEHLLLYHSVNVLVEAGKPNAGKVKTLDAKYCITLEKGRRCSTLEVIPSSKDLGTGLVYRVTCIHKRYKTYVVPLAKIVKLFLISRKPLHQRIWVFRTSWRARHPTLSPIYTTKAPLASY